jgi:hypothetical protein
MLRKLSLPLAVIVIALTGCLVPSALPAANSDSLVTRTYDLHDLINRALLYQTPSPSLSQPSGDETADLTPPPTPEQIQDDLINKIRGTIEFSTWATVPPMKFVDDTLIVVQTPAVQEKLARLLAKLNFANHPRPTIRLEAEYFDVSAAPNGNQPFLRATTNKKGGPLSADDVTTIEDAAHNDPAIKVSSATIQVENFGGGYSFTGRNLRFITGYDRVSAGATTTYQQKIATRQIGTLFSILNAIVSADGQYVTLDLRFQQNHLRGLKSLPSDQSPQLQIQMPMIDMTEVRTRITLPQDGHLILGGANGACFILLHATILPAKG